MNFTMNLSGAEKAQIEKALGETKIVRNEKAKTSCINRLLVCSYLQLMCRNPDGFPHKILRFRFFCARFRRTTYNCTPCATKSNTPNDFISPLCGEAKKAQTEKADKGMIRSFIRHKLHKSR